MYRPILTLIDEGHIQIEAPRNSAFDLDMRRFIPRQRRDARTGIWIIERHWLGAVRLILTEHYGGIYDKTGIGSMLPPDNWYILWQRRVIGASAQPVSPYTVLFLLDDAPIEVARAAHRALAKKYHPDREAGDGERMRAINCALDEIEARCDHA